MPSVSAKPCGPARQQPELCPRCTQGPDGGQLPGAGAGPRDTASRRPPPSAPQISAPARFHPSLSRGTLRPSHGPSPPTPFPPESLALPASGTGRSPALSSMVTRSERDTRAGRRRVTSPRALPLPHPLPPRLRTGRGAGRRRRAEPRWERPGGGAARGLSVEPVRIELLLHVRLPGAVAAAVSELWALAATPAPAHPAAEAPRAPPPGSCPDCPSRTPFLSSETCKPGCGGGTGLKGQVLSGMECTASAQVHPTPGEWEAGSEAALGAHTPQISPGPLLLPAACVCSSPPFTHLFSHLFIQHTG